MPLQTRHFVRRRLINNNAVWPDSLMLQDHIETHTRSVELDTRNYRILSKFIRLSHENGPATELGPLQPDHLTKMRVRKSNTAPK